MHSNKNSTETELGHCWNRGAYWNEGAYSIGVIVRIGALIRIGALSNENKLEGRARIREGAPIGRRVLNRIITVN